MWTMEIVVIGNGMVGQRLVDELVRRRGTGEGITVIGDEPHPAYDRVHLSEYFTGRTVEDLSLCDLDALVDAGVRYELGVRVDELDVAGRKIALADGRRLGFDHAVLATGSRPFVPPVPGADADGVFVYRTIEDLDRIAAWSAGRSVGVVIGGGLLGLEAAAGLKMQGMEVTVLHLMPTLMERQLDPAAGYLLEKELTGRGIDIRTSANTKEILGDTKVEGVRLEDGTEIPCDLVIMAVGIRPRILLCRADREIEEDELRKIALFCNIDEEKVIAALDAGKHVFCEKEILRFNS